MLIANPIYDVVFKYLLDDNRVARLIISALLGEEVEELEFRPTEVRAEIKDVILTVLRLDFSASIRTQDGGRKLVLIEIQKAEFPTDIMRFRRYLGHAYASDENAWTDDLGNPHALSVLSIYFLGTALRLVDAPVIRVARTYRDAATGAALSVTDEFIESLTHDSIVVQIPLLKSRRPNELEKLLSIFDQSRRAGGKHELEIDESEVPEKYRDVLRRLVRAGAEKEVRDSMTVEDDILRVLAQRDRKYAELESEVEEVRRALDEKDRTLEEARQAIADRDRLIEQMKKRSG